MCLFHLDVRKIAAYLITVNILQMNNMQRNHSTKVYYIVHWYLSIKLVKPWWKINQKNNSPMFLIGALVVTVFITGVNSHRNSKSSDYRIVLFCFVHSLNTHWPFHAGNFPDESESQSKGIVSLTGQGDQIPGIGDGEFSIVPVQTSDKTEEGQWVDINFHTLREKLISLGLIKKNAKDFHKFGTKRTETLVCSDYAIKCHSTIFS